MKFKAWLKRQITAASIAISDVEKSVLNQNSSTINDGTNHERRHGEGTLADSLLRGEITQEVRDLRWRMYKVSKEMEKNQSVFNEDGTYTLREKISESLSRIKIDNIDPYELELVFFNNAITTSLSDSINSSINEMGVISGNDYFAINKTKNPINIFREFVPKFDIEVYTKKINVRKIDEKKRLLEFYVSKYPDEYNVNSKLFLKEVKKVMERGARQIDFLDIKEVGFISNNTIGTRDLLAYGYKILTFDKIIEFDGHYVIKFICEIEINGLDILSDFVENVLDEKYANKNVRR